jgi:hypothetical protein
MNRQSIDYTNEDFFLGIDVHKNSWKVTVRTNDMELKTFSMDPSPEQSRRVAGVSSENNRAISYLTAVFLDRLYPLFNASKCLDNGKKPAHQSL